GGGSGHEESPVDRSSDARPRLAARPRFAGVIHRSRLPCQATRSDESVTPPADPSDFGTRLLDDLTTLVSRAAGTIMQARAAGLTAKHKADGSPVTGADEAAEAVILEGLAHLLP